MTKKDQQTIEHLEDLLVKALQAGKKETSGLVNDIKKDIAVIHEHNKHIKSTLSEIKEQTTKLNEKVKLNTEFRLQTTGGMMLMKWLIGVFGITSIINFLSLIGKI